MLQRLRGAQTVMLRPLARMLLRWGVGPDAVTWFGALSVTAVALICFPQGWLWQGAVLAAVLSCSDMLDGQMARELDTPSRWGSFLDASLDRIADAGVLGGLAWWLGLSAGAGWAVVAVWALVAAQATSYVKARAEAVGCRADVGLIVRADRITIALAGALLAGLGVPYALAGAVLVLAVGGTITVIQRLVTVRRQLDPQNSGPAQGKRARA
jgi:CDP-diacylglycerol--glycerol-3-phosphate 3-phosphatidyltransferase